MSLVLTSQGYAGAKTTALDTNSLKIGLKFHLDKTKIMKMLIFSKPDA